jgi:hypothetical protein
VAGYASCPPLGREVTSIPYLFPHAKWGKSRLGHVALSKRASQFDFDTATALQANTHIRKNCVIGLAGEAGTKRDSGSCDWKVAGSEDLAVVRSLIFAVAVSDEDAEIRMGKYWEEAQKIVNNNWSVICLLADTLLMKRTMNDKEVASVIKSAKAKQEPAT